MVRFGAHPRVSAEWIEQHRTALGGVHPSGKDLGG
jgi:hypothetical protein